MADEEQLKILRQGIAAWNKWREENPEAPDLRGADLRGAILVGADLCGANLFRAHLRALGRWSARELASDRGSGNTAKCREHNKTLSALSKRIFPP